MLEPGTRIGPYEVLAPLGAGGMGEVVRARDTRLGREVAIKTLPDAFAADPERLARFEREARLLAGLHHPNIAGIFGVEESGGHRHLVLELVEGPTLAERIDRGALPLDEALELARQIATGLEFAHEHGVIHRDLKPGNVKITPTGEIKVLDFGLAKGQVGSPSSSDLSNSPTVTASPTGAGVILGTAAYMSPEQARGRPVDRRTDIWSFGCVLFEMLTGRQLFAGETVTDVLAKILQTEPDWASLPAATPARVRALLARCLRKDPRERLRDIGDARIEITEVLAVGPAADTTAVPTARRGVAWPVLAGAVVLGVALTAIMLPWLTPRAPRPVRRYAIEAPRVDFGFFNAPVLSRDGRRIAYVADDRLMVRDRSQDEATPIPGAEHAESPAFSWDGTRLAFARQHRLWTIPVTGGVADPLCTLPDPGGVTEICWAPDGSVLFTLYRGGLYQVPPKGGTPRLVCAPTKAEEDFHSPQVLPDGRNVLVVAHRIKGPFAITVISLADGRRMDLRELDRVMTVCWSPEGWLLLTRSRPSSVDAIRFSLSAMRIEGDPVRLVSGGTQPRVSEDGTLIYELDPRVGLRQMLWLDPVGHVLERIGDPQPGLTSCALSRDGRRVVYTATTGEVGDIWMHDLVTGTRTPVVTDSVDKYSPVFSADGHTVFYETFASITEMVMAAVDRTAPSRDLGPGDNATPTPDGRWLVYANEERGHSSIWMRPLAGPDPPRPAWRSSGGQEYGCNLSPDGHWIAYGSAESGRPEIYARSFPGGGDKQMVSRRGGDGAFWSPAGDAILYVNGDTLFRAPFRGGAPPTIGEPRASFAKRDVGDELEVSAVAADGRILASRRSLDDPRRGILVVENWAEELRGR